VAIEDYSNLVSGQASHFALTQFNVRTFWHTAEPTDEWLRYRLGLFEAFTVPSFAGQTSRDFTWLVFFDALTPPWLRERVAELAAGAFEPVYVEGELDAAYLSRELGRRCTTPYLLTTGVDSDDAVAVDFIETIQRSFAPAEREVVNLVNGAQYCGGRFYLRPYTRNPFCTMVEHVETAAPITVYADFHYKIDLLAPVRNVRTAHPMWLQVVHGRNILNEIVGLRVRPGAVTPHFAAQLPERGSLVGVWAEQLRGALRIGARLVSRPHRLLDLAHAALARTSPRTN